tara:strand:+ start:720 stop:1151 length:432 start_codon:yes stop_codon:yes gene_type:complete
MKKKVLIVSASYYKNITKSLIDDSVKLLKKNRILYKNIDVPGIFEIPVTISKNINKYNGFIALGCVIKGETPHFDYISKSTFDALMTLSINSKKPIGNGIITALNMGQALKRSGIKTSVLKKNIKKGKGVESTKAIISILTQK